MTRPNRDLWQAGAALQDYIATNLTAALEHINRELSILDGYPAGNDEPNVTATSELTTVERTADARWQLTNAREDIRDHKAAVLVAIRELNEYINLVSRMRVPRTVTRPEDKKKDLCCSGQMGKHKSIEWGNPDCLMPAVKKGLCQSHYDAWRYACIRDGVDRSADFQPAQ